MKKAPYLLFFLVLLAACTRKVVPGASSVATYSEDLRILHPAIVSAYPDNNPAKKPRAISPEVPLDTKHDITGELDSVMKFIAQNNIQKKYFDGFTIQVYSGSNREKAYSAQAQVRSLKLELTAQIIYIQPNFRVKVGRFYSRLEANKSFFLIKKQFPNALLLPEKIPIE